MREYVRNFSFLIVVATLMTACASESLITRGESPMSSPEACAANDGVWIPVKDLYPDKELIEDDMRRFICRLRTHEEGRACTNDRQCRGGCLAPPGAVSGQEVVGTCSEFTWLVDGTRTMTDGKVRFPMVSPELTEDKISRLKKLAFNRDKWSAHAIRDYDMTLERSCHCLFGPYYGPNKVSVRDGEIFRVVYRGERRDGYKPGDRLTNQKALENTVDGIFDDLEKSIRSMTSNTILLVEYDEQYGFPVIVDYDRPDIADEESKLTVVDFVPK